MTQAEIETRIAEIAELMRAKLGGRGTTLRAVLRKARPQLPRRIRSRAKLLADAEPFAHHPQLRLTLDAGALERAASEVAAHLKAIDLADRRKGWWLGMLGGLAFNVLLMAAVLIVLLRWRGFI